MKRTLLTLLLTLAMTLSAVAQITSGTILGTIRDASGAPVSGAGVKARNIGTNDTRELTASTEGTFRFPQLPPGSYEVTVTKAGFGKYVQGPIVLRSGQDADLSIKLEVASVTETISVNTDAPLLNTTNAEVSTNFESKRISELPLAPNRNILNLALSVPGVSQLSSGQSNFAAGGVNFSSNGMRVRSNNFMIDGQDSNDPSVTGNQQTINNPDIVAEVKIVTNQFMAEYGRTAGSVVSIITKSGTNELHGSAFWFYNSNALNTLSNQEVNARVTQVPFLNEHQFGGTVGGPVLIPKVYNGKDKTFFFTSLQKWTVRQVGFGSTLDGAPTEAGRQMLSGVSQGRAQVQALLTYLPAAEVASGKFAPLNTGTQTLQIPLGRITGSTGVGQTNYQGTARFDHRFNDRNLLTGRYMVNDDLVYGSGQVTPPGLTTVSPSRAQSATLAWNYTPAPAVFNEMRVSYQRLVSQSDASNSASQAIPSLEVGELGLVGINAAASRTAIGLAVNLPQFRRNNTYQLQNTTSWIKGKHSIKGGIDFRRVDIVSFFGPTSRGSLSYDTLQRLYDDVATVATINATLPGGDVIWPFKQYDYYWFLQDEWRVSRRFTLTYGLRWESPGPSLDSLIPINNRIVAAAGNNEAYRMTNRPARDLNNWAPRVGFNYRFGQGPGLLGWLTGNEQLVLRGGYARSYDHNFVNLTLNVASAFPFLNSVNFISGGVATQAFTKIQNARFSGVPANPATANRTILSPDQRSAVAEQYSMQMQREFARDWGVTVGWVATKGTGLFQTIDGNPIIPGSGGRRVDPNFGVLRNRCNCAASIYHSLQTSLEKRLSKNFAMGAHYTWAKFIDYASELFNPNALSDVALPQDSYNRRADRGPSTFDRTHRFTVNGVYEVPFLRDQKGFAGKVVGGWQISPFLTLQTGAPFTVLNGADPGGRLSGISGLVGVAIRPNVNTTMDLSSMGLPELYRIWNSIPAAQRATQGFFTPVTAAQGIGNAGRGILRADGIGNMDLSVMKNTKIGERVNTQLRGDFFNFTNTRNFGLPDGRITSAAFLNQWNTDAGRRRVQVSLRVQF
ncbi:MAG: TonB-dependent receptor [Candidatus Solibacter usitatus]|nr:TonB-dependent receptor [Candidatus Solibacter usitatus]